MSAEETEEIWISAYDALQHVSRCMLPAAATRAICTRAHAGLVRARARRFPKPVNSSKSVGGTSMANREPSTDAAISTTTQFRRYRKRPRPGRTQARLGIPSSRTHEEHHAEHLRRDVAASAPRARPRRLPYPPWAVRALVEHVIGQPGSLRQLTCLEPACGRGHTAKALAEYFGHVEASDIHAYGFGSRRRLHVEHARGRRVRLGDHEPALPPRRGVHPSGLADRPLRRGDAVADRVRRGYRPLPADVRALSAEQGGAVTERVPMVQGRLDRKASTATGYAWLVWEKGFPGRRSSAGSRLAAAPRARRRLLPDRSLDDWLRFRDRREGEAA